MIHPRRTTQLLIGLSALTLAATGCPNGAPDELPREKPSSKTPAAKPKATTSAPAEEQEKAKAPRPNAPAADAPKAAGSKTDPPKAATPKAKTSAPKADTPNSDEPKFRSSWTTLKNGLRVMQLFDDRDRLVAVAAKGYRRIFSWDERDLLRSHLGADGREEMFMYDKNRLLTHYTSAAGSAAYRRDAEGRLLKVITPGDRTWTFKHDGDKVVLEDGATGPIRHDFDAQGRTKRVRDASGRAQVFARGATAKGKWVDISTATGETIQQRFNTNGKLLQVKTEGHTIDYRYPSKTSFVIKTPQAELTYDVLANGSVTIKTPFGGFARGRGKRGKTVRIVGPGQRIFDYTRNERGFRTRVAYPNGTAATFARDFMSRVTKIDHPAFRFEAEYDKRHEQVRRVEHGVETRFERDRAGRINKVLREGKVVRQFGHDADGNRTLEVDARGTKRTASFDARFRITRFGSDTYTHDAAGRLTSRKHAGGTDTFRYDGFGRLVEVERADQPAVTYGYDGQNRIVRRTVNKQTTHFVWEGEKLLAEVGPGKRTRVYVDGDDMGAPLAYLEGGELTILHADNRGTVLAYSDKQGKQVARAQFGIFGELKQVPADRPLFYGSHWVDPIARVIPMRARVYEPTLGRFLTPDPSGLDGGFNPYVYGDNDPVDHVDPQGLKATDLNDIVTRLGTDLEEADKARLVDDLIKRAEARAQASDPSKIPPGALEVLPSAVGRWMVKKILGQNQARTNPLERLEALKQVLSGAKQTAEEIEKIVDVAPIDDRLKDTIKAAVSGAKTAADVSDVVSNLRKALYPTDEERAEPAHLFKRFVAFSQALKHATDKIPVVADYLGASLDAIKAMQGSAVEIAKAAKKRDDFIKNFNSYVTSQDALEALEKETNRIANRLELLDPKQVISEVISKRLAAKQDQVIGEYGKLSSEFEKIARTDRSAVRALERARKKGSLTEDDVQYAETRIGNARRLSKHRRKRYAVSVGDAVRDFLRADATFRPVLDDPNLLLRRAGYDFSAKRRAANRMIARHVQPVDATAPPAPKLSRYLAMARKLKTKTQPSSRKWKVAKTKGAKKRLDDMFSR